MYLSLPGQDLSWIRDFRDPTVMLMPMRVPDNRAKAAGLWKKKRLGGIEPLIIHAVEMHKGCDQWKKEGGEYIPLPATWLSQERWEDEVKAPTPSSSSRRKLHRPSVLDR